MSQHSKRQQIFKTLKDKSSLKQDIYSKAHHVFEDIKTVLKELERDLQDKVSGIDKRLTIEYRDRGDFEIEFKVAGDTLVFLFHTNIFTFDKDHNIWKTSYVQSDHSRSYFGMISIYNFLSDSFKYNRVNDIGYLIARIFINKDMHFFVEGKKQMSFLYNDLEHAKINYKNIRDVLESAILYCLQFDLFTPPYNEVQLVSVQEMIEVNNITVSTGKRLGFRFQADEESIK